MLIVLFVLPSLTIPFPCLWCHTNAWSPLGPIPISFSPVALEAFHLCCDALHMLLCSCPSPAKGAAPLTTAAIAECLLSVCFLGCFPSPAVIATLPHRGKSCHYADYEAKVFCLQQRYFGFKLQCHCSGVTLSFHIWFRLLPLEVRVVLLLLVLHKSREKAYTY